MAPRARLDWAAIWLRDVLPDGWSVSVARRGSNIADIRFTAPTGGTTVLDVTTLSDATPRSIAGLSAASGPRLVLADWLSERSRELLRSRGASFLDVTGNAEIRLDEPGLFIRTDGADRNPSPRPSTGPGLRGPKAWALLRTLAEVPPPFGVRELAQSVGVDAGYVSRVLRALEDELLITRNPRGPVTSIEWEGVLRKAASTYSLFDSNDTSTWVATSGPERLVEDLAGKRTGPWAVTGSFAAARLVSVTAPEIAVIYTDDPERVVKVGRMLPAPRSANVILARPYDPSLLSGPIKQGGVAYVSTAQVVLDSLTGNGRMPAEGEAVLAWMRRNEPRWRNGRLETGQDKRRA